MDGLAAYQFRSPIEDDLDAVADVLHADQSAEGVEPTIDAHFLRQVWSRPDFDLAADAWVVSDAAGSIVAYGQVRLDDVDLVGSWGVVHPAHRGRGIGSSLFDRIEQRASELLVGAGSPQFRHAILGGDRAAAAMVAGRGLSLLRHFWHMQIDLDEPIEQGPAPDGIEIDLPDPRDDLRAIHGIIESAFADDPGGHPVPFEQWAEEQTTNPTFDPTLWLLARDGDLPVGVLTASAGDDVGWVDWVAVLGSHRGRGIASALLRRAFAMFAARGLRRVRLNVDAQNVTGATAVYERVGMRIVNRWELWERT